TTAPDSAAVRPTEIPATADEPRTALDPRYAPRRLRIHRAPRDRGRTPSRHGRHRPQHAMERPGLAPHLWRPDPRQGPVPPAPCRREQGLRHPHRGLGRPRRDPRRPCRRRRQSPLLELRGRARRDRELRLEHDRLTCRANIPPHYAPKALASRSEDRAVVTTRPGPPGPAAGVREGAAPTCGAERP